MIRRAEERGTIKPGDTLIEPTSGNTGIALAMVAAMRGYRMVLVMPEHLSVERRQTMARLRRRDRADAEGRRHGGRARPRRAACVAEGKGVMLDQFANPDNPRAHYEGTGPEIWRDTDGRITHFVSQHGHDRHDHGRVALPQGEEPGDPDHRLPARPRARRSPASASGREAYLPKIYDRSSASTAIEYVSQADAEEMARRLAREEGIFAGISSGGAVRGRAADLRARSRTPSSSSIVCDRGDRYLSTGVFPA